MSRRKATGNAHRCEACERPALIEQAYRMLPPQLREVLAVAARAYEPGIRDQIIVLPSGVSDLMVISALDQVRANYRRLTRWAR